MASSAAHTLLTTLIVSPSDLKHVRRDLEALDDTLRQAGLRQGGKAVALPQPSRFINALAEESKANLLRAGDRQQLLQYLSTLVEKAPVLHISFASEPSAAFMNKLIIWLRSNIHPQLLVHLGLQPSIAAGCIVRTPNKQFDFSLAQAFEKQRELLVASLLEITPDESAVPVATAVAALENPATAQASVRQPAPVSDNPVAKPARPPTAIKVKVETAA